MIKRSYNRTLYIIGVIGCFAFSFFSFKEAWDFQQSLMPSCFEFCSDTEEIRNGDVAMALLFLFTAVASIFGLRSAERRDQRRQRAAQNSQGGREGVKEDPAFDKVRLSLPIEIRTRISRQSIVQLLGLFWSIVSVAVVVLLIFVLHDSTLHDFDYVELGIFSLSLYLFMTLFPLFAVIIIREKMKITEDSIIIHSGGRTHSVYWRDAKLFARPPLTSDEKTSPQFELASTRSRVVWNFVTENRGFLAGPQPTIPYAEYARIMEALPALITAKTGLPLYDLRTE